MMDMGLSEKMTVVKPKRVSYTDSKRSIPGEREASFNALHSHVMSASQMSACGQL